MVITGADAGGAAVFRAAATFRGAAFFRAAATFRRDFGFAVTFFFVRAAFAFFVFAPRAFFRMRSS